MLLHVASSPFETGCQRLYQNFVKNIKSQLVCFRGVGGDSVKTHTLVYTFGTLSVLPVALGVR